MPLESAELEALVIGTLQDTSLLVLVFGNDGCVSWINSAVEDTLDVMREDVEGHPSQVLLRGELPALEGTTRRVEGDFQLARSDGSVVWVQGGLSRVRDGAGRRLGTALLASTTVGGSHWHHKLLRGTLPAAMGMMGAEVAHKVNNPSTWLRLNLDQLRTDLVHPGTLEPQLARELLDECKEGLERIGEIVGELRDLAVPSPEEFELTDLREVVTAACSLAPLAEAGRVTIRSELAEVPRLKLAPGRVGQAVWSLLALCVRVMVRAEESDSLVVHLHDDGEYVFLDLQAGSPLALDPETYQAGSTSQGPAELRMARTVLASHGGMVLPVPQGHGLRIQLPIVTPRNPLRAPGSAP